MDFKDAVGKGMFCASKTTSSFGITKISDEITSGQNCFMNPAPEPNSKMGPGMLVGTFARRS